MRPRAAAQRARVGAQHLERLERRHAAGGEPRREERGGDARGAHQDQRSRVDREVLDREAQLVDHPHRRGHHAEQQLAERQPERDAKRRAERAEDARLEHQQAEKLRRIGAREAQRRQHQRALHRSGRGGVVDDVDAGDETQQAEAGEHGLERRQDALVERAALERRRDQERRRQRRGEARLDVGHPRARPQHHVDLVDHPLAAENELRCGKVHHRQDAAEGAREALRLEQPAHGEFDQPLAGREVQRLSRGEVVAQGERAGEGDRPGIGEPLERVAAAGQPDVIALQGVLLREVDAEQLERLAGIVRQRQRAAHQPERDLHAGIGAHRVDRPLGEPDLAGAERDLELCRSRDQLQRPAEVVEHGVVDDRDRDHQGDPGGDPADDQRGPGAARPQLVQADLTEKAQHGPV